MSRATRLLEALREERKAADLAGYYAGERDVVERYRAAKAATDALVAAPDVAVLWVDYVGSDWVGIYADGEKVYEGHPPNADDAFAAIGVEVGIRSFPSAGLADLRRMRGLPARLPAAEA